MRAGLLRAAVPRHEDHPDHRADCPRLTEFATACGEALARAHARTGDPVAINGYIGKGPKFTAEISRFARRYAGQTERDRAQLVAAITAGAVESLPG